jgi:hypothetical protein
MAKKNGNLLSGLNAVLFGESIPKEFKRTTRYDIGNSSPVIFSTNNREEYEAKKLFYMLSCKAGKKNSWRLS